MTVHYWGMAPDMLAIYAANYPLLDDWSFCFLPCLSIGAWFSLMLFFVVSSAECHVLSSFSLTVTGPMVFSPSLALCLCLLLLWLSFLIWRQCVTECAKVAKFGLQLKKALFTLPQLFSRHQPIGSIACVLFPFLFLVFFIFSIKRINVNPVQHKWSVSVSAQREDCFWVVCIDFD